MKPIVLYSHELNRLLSTGSVTVWRPMKPQPPEGYRSLVSECDIAGNWWFTNMPVKNGERELSEFGRYDHFFPKAPHPPGSERWVRERCAIWTGPSDDVVYDDDPDWCELGSDNEALEKIASVKGRWKILAAKEMPRWASRLSVVSKAVQARQVQSITEKECWESGVYRIGPELETTLPVMACEEPQVKEGMAFGYREKPFISYAGKPRIAFMFLWDGRYNPRGYCPEDAPQGWDANPWAWATTLERKEG